MTDPQTTLLNAIDVLDIEAIERAISQGANPNVVTNGRNAWEFIATNESFLKEVGTEGSTVSMGLRKALVALSEAPPATTFETIQSTVQASTRVAQAAAYRLFLSRAMDQRLEAEGVVGQIGANTTSTHHQRLANGAGFVAMVAQAASEQFDSSALSIPERQKLLNVRTQAFEQVRMDRLQSQMGAAIQSQVNQAPLQVNGAILVASLSMKRVQSLVSHPTPQLEGLQELRQQRQAPRASVAERAGGPSP